MTQREEIDVSFNFKSDTPAGKDPDIFSPTLRRYHQLLWSKPLPCERRFDLDDTTPKAYLHHKSELGEFFLASDTVIPSFTRDGKYQHIIEQIPTAELDEFNALGYTMGGMMLFPGRRIGRKMTINSARGFHPLIKDRFDLTVECILRHYSGQKHPLSGPLERYADFFDLFGDFRGFVHFFLLEDIVTEDCASVRHFTPFDDFQTSPLPPDKAAYLSYVEHAAAFIEARNRRIARYWKTHGRT